MHRRERRGALGATAVAAEQEQAGGGSSTLVDGVEYVVCREHLAQSVISTFQKIKHFKL
jgi:hypothetical protein